MTTPSESFEQIRRKHLTTEALYRLMGSLLIFSGFCTVLVVGLVGGLKLASGPEGLDLGTQFSTGQVVFLILLSGVNVVAGWHLKRLSSKGRFYYTITAAISGGQLIFDKLFGEASSGVNEVLENAIQGFSLATGFLILVAFWSKSGKVVTSEFYKEKVIPATPKIRTTSRGVLIFLALTLPYGVMMSIGIGDGMDVAMEESKAKHEAIQKKLAGENTDN